MDEITIDQAVIAYLKEKHTIQAFLNQVKDYFLLDPDLNNEEFPIIHSLKFRLKDPEHLRKKLKRKVSEGRIITKDTIFNEVTDLAGIRILHLYMDQFSDIHNKLMEKIELEDWALVEPPKAYTWDPEVEELFKKYNLNCTRKESFYTSVDSLIQIRPNNKNQTVVCELQVRTLFEEIWGEIDHNINYPKPTGSIACREQLRVLARLVSTGTRLAGSIYNSHKEYGTMQLKKE